MAMDFRRGKTSKDCLTIDWSYPVWKPEAALPQAGTVAKEQEHVLSSTEAYELISKGDQRPLLVLRECELCKGTDHALLSSTLNNEQTELLTHWFHCVKLPPNVLDADHPFHSLFAVAEGKRAPHLFFCDSDGSNRSELPGDQSQAELWRIMFSFLDREYEGNAKQAVKDLRSVLSQFDRVDAAENDVKSRIDKEIDKHGPRSPRLVKLQADLADLQGERARLHKRADGLRQLALKPPADKPAGTAAGSASGG
jgi:hypothetical protein